MLLCDVVVLGKPLNRGVARVRDFLPAPDHVEVDVRDDAAPGDRRAGEVLAPSDPFSSPFQSANTIARAGRVPCAAARANADAIASTAAVPDALSSAPL